MFPRALPAIAAALAMNVGSAWAQPGTVIAQSSTSAAVSKVQQSATGISAALAGPKPAATPYDQELNEFGKLLAPADGPALNGLQALMLYGLEFQYRGFGRPKDAVRIAQVFVNKLEHDHAEYPHDSSLSEQLDQARFLLVLAQFDDGQPEAFSDEVQRRLAKASDTHSTHYRQLLLDLSLASMRSGSFAIARDAAQRGLDLSQPPSLSVPVASNADAQKRQADCLALEQKVLKSLSAHEHITDEEAASRSARLGECTTAASAAAQIDIDSSLYDGLLYQLSVAQSALGEDAAAEATLRKLLATTDGGYRPQAALDLAELLKSAGDPKWRQQALLARHFAKWDVGVRDDVAPYAGTFLPVQWVIGPRDAAGITGLTMLRAGETELLLGNASVAITYLRAATPSLDDLLSRAGLASARGDYLMGEALLESDDAAKALPYLKSASSAFDGFSPTSRDLRRMALNRFEGATDVHLAYLDAANAAGDKAAINEAILRAGRSRLSRSLDAALERAGAKGDAPEVRKAQDIARRATDLDGDLQLAISRGAKADELAVAERAAETGHQAASAALREAMARDPGFRLFSYGEVAPMEAVQHHLPASSAMLIYAFGRDRAFAAAITKDRVVVHKIEASRLLVQRLVAAVRSSSEFHKTSIGLKTIPFNFEDSAKLYALLIAPFAAELSGAKKLFISRSPPLDGLAFAELWDQPHGRFLVDEAATSIILDPSLLATVAPAHPIPPLKVLAMGNPKVNAQSLLRDFTVDDAHPVTQAGLPGAHDEMAAVVGSYGPGAGSVIIEGADATVRRFRLEASKGYKVIALATHAVTQDAPLRDPRPAIVFTPGAEGGDNGLLHTDDIESLKINTDLVILSACETASGDGAPGAEALSGLAQAFLFAGARNVLATQWKVESGSAARLMTLSVSRRSADSDASSRLRNAMLAVKAAPETKHPAYWAPFVLVEGFVGEAGKP